MSRKTAWFGVAAACALVACGRNDVRTGSATVQVSAALSTRVEEVSLRVYDAAGGLYDQSFTLTRGAGSDPFVGTIAGLPLQLELTFDATAVDPLDGTIYAGSATFTLHAPGEHGQLAIVLQEVGAPTFGNHAPIIGSVSASHLVAPPGTTVHLAVAAIDPDGDSLSYAWSVAPAIGAFSVAAAAATDWTPPAGATGSYTFTVEVTDGPARGGTARASIVVVVSDTLTPANVAIRAIVNNAPVILGIAVEQQYDPAVEYPSQLTLSYSDADGPAPVTFLWSVDQSLAQTDPGAGCAGSFIPGDDVQSPLFVPTSAGVDGMCVLLVEVSDAGGARNLGRVSVQAVAPPTSADPRLVAWFQSAGSVPDGGAAVVSASFMKAEAVLDTVYAAFLADGTTPATDVGIEVPADPAGDPNAARLTFLGACGGAPEVRVVRANPIDPDLPPPGVSDAVSKVFQVTFCAP